MEKRIGLQNLDNDILRARDRRLVVAETKGHDFDRDRYELARVGKEQVLKVSFGRTYSSAFVHTWRGEGTFFLSPA